MYSILPTTWLSTTLLLESLVLLEGVWILSFKFLNSATKLWENNVFSLVRLSIHGIACDHYLDLLKPYRDSPLAPSDKFKLVQLDLTKTGTILFMKFFRNFGKIVCWHPWGLAVPPSVNSGSAPVSESAGRQSGLLVFPVCVSHPAPMIVLVSVTVGGHRFWTLIAFYLRSTSNLHWQWVFKLFFIK